LPAEVLDRLRSPKLTALLSSSRLQALIRHIDGARDRVNALEAAKRSHGAEFQAFIDEMLVAVGACVRRPDGSVEFVG